MTQLFLTRRLRSALFGCVVSAPLLLLGACGSETASTDTGEASSEAETATTEADGAPRLALISSGTSNDQSWNQAAFEAGEALKAEGVDFAMSEAVDPADAAAVLRQYAEEGYDLIVAHSFNYQDAVFQVSREFPNVNFAWAGGIGGTSENVADYDQPFYEGAYLVGLIAAELSETGKLGALYGFDIPVCNAMGEAMLAGAQSVRPDATLTSTAVGDWIDVAKAKEATLSQAETGVDFWIGCGQGPALGQIEAAKEVDGLVTGYVGDMSSLGPEVVASSVVWNMEPLFSQMLEDTSNDTFAEQYYRLGVADDVVQVVVPPEFQDDVGEDVVKALDETKAQIVSGELEVPFVPE